MLLVKADESSEAGVLPSKELVAAMGTFNEEMAKAGVMLAADGLHPSSKGARVAYAGTKRTVTDGPFTETKELIAGYWVIQVESKAKAIDWASRAPFQGGQVEVRQVFEASDFPADVFPPEEAAREEALREQTRRNAPKP
jgi:hypothetical protein